MGLLDVTPLMGAAAGEPGHETSSPIRRFRRACACGSFTDLTDDVNHQCGGGSFR